MAGSANPNMVQPMAGNPNMTQPVARPNMQPRPFPYNPNSREPYPFAPTDAQTMGSAPNPPITAPPNTPIGSPPNTPMGASPYQRASSANMQAFNTYANPTASAANMMNPYNQQVVNSTLRDVGNSALMGQNQLDAQAQAAGAFGGSRHGIQGAEALKGFNQQALDKVGALRQQGYQQSMNNAFNAAQGLQSTGQQAFGMGNQLQQNQMQQGAMQQQMMQNLINAGKQQYAGFTGQPLQNLNTMMGTISAQPTMAGKETSFQPGLFNYLQFAAGLA